MDLQKGNARVAATGGLLYQQTAEKAAAAAAAAAAGAAAGAMGQRYCCTMGRSPHADYTAAGRDP